MLNVPSQLRRQARQPAIPSAVIGTLFFVIAEVMFFAGLISAFTITRANQPPGLWPPPGQPLLPTATTGFNTALLLLSGVALLLSYTMRKKPSPTKTAKFMLMAWVLGASFVVLQGREWLALLRQGLTLTSSQLGSFFYVIVGGHAVHALGALFVLAYACWQQLRGCLSSGLFLSVQTFWYFVVLMWPIIYGRVYF